MSNHRISVEIPEELHKRIKIKAYTEGRNIKEVVTEILTEWVERTVK